MSAPDDNSVGRQDRQIRDLLLACPSVAEFIDLSEGVNYNFSLVGGLLRDGKLGAPLESCLYKYLNQMADGDKDVQNLLVVNVLEILCDTPQSVARARGFLCGRALLLFERVLRGWTLHPK